MQDAKLGDDVRRGWGDVERGSLDADNAIADADGSGRGAFFE